MKTTPDMKTANSTRVLPRFMRSKTLLLTILAFLTTVWLTGCQPGLPTERNPEAKAFLNTETGEITLPLDQYGFGSTKDWIILKKATNIAQETCMKKRGIDYTAPAAQEIEENRTYGLWVIENAKRYGFSPPPTEEENPTTETFIPEDPSDPVSIAYEECSQQVDKEFEEEFNWVLLMEENPNLKLPTQLSLRASTAARKDPAWQQARQDWWQCLREEGLTPSTGENEWGAEEEKPIFEQKTLEEATRELEASEEEIRVAVIEAECNNKVGLTQRLADLEASYQKPLIDKNEVALKQTKEEVIKIRKKLENYIRTND